jgi:hypothetical protein
MDTFRLNRRLLVVPLKNRRYSSTYATTHPSFVNNPRHYYLLSTEFEITPDSKAHITSRRSITKRKQLLAT